MKIKVTQDDIDNGDRKNAYSCAVALACMRAGIKSPKVDTDEINEINEHGGSQRTWDTPRMVARFIERFDDRRPVKPFSFELPEVENQ